MANNPLKVFKVRDIVKCKGFGNDLFRIIDMRFEGDKKEARILRSNSSNITYWKLISELKRDKETIKQSTINRSVDGEKILQKFGRNQTKRF